MVLVLYIVTCNPTRFCFGTGSRFSETWYVRLQFDVDLTMGSYSYRAKLYRPRTFETPSPRAHSNKVKVKFSLCLTKYHTMKTYPVLS
jgi:hypothetical protein